MYAVFDDKGYMSLKFKTIKEVERCAEEWKDNYLGEGVDFDSYIAIVEFADNEDFEEIRRWSIIVDEELHKEIGSPEQNGYEFQFWAKWEEMSV